MGKSNIKFTIKCKKCGLIQPCKPFMLGKKKACKCGYEFNAEEFKEALERVKTLRKQA